MLLRMALKKQTAALHGQLDHTRAASPFLPKNIGRCTIDDYVWFVRLAMRTELVIWPLLNSGAARTALADLNIPARNRIPLLRADLLALGMPEPKFNALQPFDWGWNDELTVGDAIGIWYVREGGTLGANFFGPQVETRLGLTAQTGSSALRCYANVAGGADAMFEAFAAVANRYDPESEEGRTAIARAQAFFRKLIEEYSKEPLIV